MLDKKALDLIFMEARSHNGWLAGEVTDEQLHRLWDILKMGPTSANSSPARIVFARSAAAKEKLKPALIPGNVEKTMTAPVCAIIGYDTKFYEHLPKLFPHKPEAVGWYTSSAAFAEATAFRNGSLQGAYFMIAARTIGLDVGPMSGFDNAKVDAAFFPGGRIKSNFLCNIGHGDPSKIFGRSPRFSFDEVCSIE
ncbi:MAG: malonic semialdehyde reductase [Alphaproteobacteria bacterium]|nr:malonic semialdehyde reductase [Alphaproteobacteria bacterium]